MRRRLLIGVALAAVVLALTLSWSWRQWTRPQGDATGPTVLVRIPPGMTLAAAADTLVVRGLLADRRVLLLGARLVGRDRALRAGLYALSPAQSPRELLQALSVGGGVQVRVTIPEGLDADEVADLVSGRLDCEREAFLVAADSLVRVAMTTGGLLATDDDPDRLEALLAQESVRLPRRLRLCEGYLAPDTYLFAAGTSARAAAGHLVATQLARLREAFDRATRVETIHELLVLASIVEAEARRADERTRIAAVYVNRLDRGWRLEADPTVAHVLAKKGQRLFYRDLEVESAWNTYRRGGLPPGPIGSPGSAALAAAAVPDPASDALFFVADGADGHVFSRTAAEHEAAVQRFRRVREAERRRAGD